MKEFKRKTLIFIATLGPIGRIPGAPGTYGSLVSAVFLFTLKPTLPVLVSITAFLMILGFFASSAAEKHIGRKDPQPVIIDEFTGYLVSMEFLPQTVGYFIAAFILFRVLDILKPPPIRRIEELSSGMGIMADDIIAGVYTNLILQAWKLWT